MNLLLVLLVSSVRTLNLESDNEVMLDTDITKAPKLQEEQVIPEESFLPETEELPESQEISAQEIAESPGSPETEQLPEAQEILEAQEIAESESPGSPETEQLPEVQEILEAEEIAESESPGSPETEQLPEVQEILEAQEIAESPVLPEKEELPEAPELSGLQGFHETQEMPDTLILPGAQALSNTQALPEVQQLNDSNNQTKLFAWSWIASHLFTTTTKPHQPYNPQYDYCEKCLCGVPNLTRRIVGGLETKLLQFPWMAALMNGASFFCGGSLITDRHVLTAAHCTAANMRNLIVKLLEHDRASTFETTTLVRRVKSVVVYPQYDPELYDNDIAILKLDEPVNITSELRPVCLPTSNSSFAGRTGLVTGWGALMEGGSTSTKLQQVSVPIMTLASCRRHYLGGSITENMMCAGYREGGKDSCQGDSGGPLHFYNDSIARYQQIGVVSWGEGCARPNKPGVYSRVNRFMTWIKTTTKGGCYCT